MAADEKSLQTLLILIFASIGHGKVLTPPYFNLAQERSIIASSTCGEVLSGQELYCRLTGGSSERKTSGDASKGIIQGQFCDVCDPAVPEKKHPVEYAIDGTNRWWQSPPLSRGMQYNQVNLTIDLEQEFHVAYVLIKMANSPRPGVWALERSTDFGKTWLPWQYFADTESDCMKFFKTPANQEIQSDDSVVCSTQFSKIVPLEDGEIVVSLVNNRPSAMNFSYATTLQRWTKATNVRLRLLRTKTLLGHLMAVARQDPTVTRRYFYSIKDISIGGRCVCNGHADTCDRGDSLNPNLLVCNCQHNTCGNQCDSCCPGFVQKKWQPARVDKIFMCEPCQCYGHSNDCVYDAEVDRQGLSIDVYGNYEGGGVCQNCQHNTYGVNCDKCVAGFYRPYGVLKNDSNPCRACVCDLRVSTGECEEGSGRCLCRQEYTGVNCDRCSPGYEGYPNCVPCKCNINGTEGELCSVEGTPCPCKPNYVGQRCDMCASGFYNFPECLPCQCQKGSGSVDNNCDVETGQCQCQPSFAGQNCDQCTHGYFNYPACTLCDCDQYGTEEEICNKTTGTCLCKTSFQYPRCDRCAPGYYNYPTCQECQCTEEGSLAQVCREDGQCPCRGNFAGLTCGRCHPGYYRYPECKPCECDRYGAYGVSCDQTTGQCQCRPTFQGLMCSQCKEGFYNYPMCEDCNCNPAGAKEVPGYPLGGCGEVIKGRLCECKERVMGRICDQCMPGYYNLDRNNPLGCEECSCYAPGTISGLNMCNPSSGQCSCKLDVTGRRCDTCRSGFFGLSDANPFGCTECNCDSGGSLSLRCEQRTGQCPCKPRVSGRRCDVPDRMHFYPTLQQFIYEIEDGRTPEGSQIRYGFDENYFANFSWRGYAILTAIQPEVVMDVEITKPSLYRLIYRYVNVNDKVLRGQVMLKPQNLADDTQNSEVFFQMTNEPKFVTVGSAESQYDFVLNPGRWMISISSPDILLLDYMVLVPQAYYEATVLQEKVTRPCTIPGDRGPCIYYNYPDLTSYPTVNGENGYVFTVNGSRENTQVFPNDIILNELGIPALAQLDKNQRDLNLNLVVPQPGDYVLVFNYFALSNHTQELDVSVSVGGEDTSGTVLLYSCQYSVLCRQVMKSIDDMPTVITINDTAQIKVTGDQNVDVAIGSVVAIPYDEWSLGFIRPSIICIRINGICVGSGYTIPVGSLRIDFEDPPNSHLILPDVPDYIKNTNLIQLNSTNQYVELTVNVQDPGQYVAFVHFYMPNEPGINIPVTVYTEDSQVFTGMFQPRFCPTLAGCRGQIMFDDSQNNILNLRPGNVIFAFNNTMGKEILLDYLMVAPVRQFSITDLNLQPIDNSVKFLGTCVGPGFQLINDTEFCRSGVYTLTTDFNIGALSCDCDTDGSLSFECSNFGGQCKCRENVIGQKCTQCREGFYGFPRCKPCNCPYGMCNPYNGACMCPPRVTGDRCDKCEAASYGYDPLVGCTNCACNADGVLNNDMNCDQARGECSCKPNVGGRKCDYCVPGFHSFPYCYECSNCDSKGTQEAICNAADGTCLCKENVAAPDCESCESGSFYLDTMNPKGCTQCFCFGTTSKCQSSSLVWEKHQDMSGWGVTNTQAGSLRSSADIIAVLESENKVLDSSKPMYWIAPSSYLGDQVTSYGGKLRFEIFYEVPRNSSSQEFFAPNIILMGSNITLQHTSLDPPPTQMSPQEVTLTEYNFVKSEDGLGVSRETFMLVLVNLKALHIQANYFSPVTQVRLQNVQMDKAVEKKEEEKKEENSGGLFAGFFFGGGGDDDDKKEAVDLALSVEQCQCPMGYKGSSCQMCAEGYYRSQRTPYLGVCVPCNCHGHASTCDSETGQCLNCTDNTLGNNCESCLPGYYGDATKENCRICSCPLPIPSNNFASGCQVYNNQLYSCDCLPGYTGRFCDKCAPGFYGDPTQEGSICRPCECSGNINTSDPDACSAANGECLKCLNNTSGPNCAYCEDWYHGDAVKEKNCQECSCDRCGSYSCNKEDGVCGCKPNVMGANCDQCMPNTYGFSQCQGCLDCNCEPASVTGQCDAVTGKCECQPGVEGMHCDVCIEGFWNYTQFGCQACECEDDGAITCDRVTGRCQCLPGVGGERCDRCLPRYILVPQQGCKACDSCVHILLDDMDMLESNISTLSTTLESVSVGMTANNRLEAIRREVDILRPQVDGLLAGPQNVSLDPLYQNLRDIENRATQGKIRSDQLKANADYMVIETRTLVTNADTVENTATETNTSVNNVVQYAENILNQIEQGIKITNIDTFIRDSIKIQNQINSVNFTMAAEECQTEEELARELLARMKFVSSSNEKQKNGTQVVMEDVNDVTLRLYDLQKNSRNSDNRADDAEHLLEDLQKTTKNILQTRLTALDASHKDTTMLQEMSNNLLDDARDALDASKVAAQEGETTASQLDVAMVRMRSVVGNLSVALEDAGDLVNRSQQHAINLADQADFLENVYTDTRETSANALNAAKAYRSIVGAIDDAYNASTVALSTAEDAQRKSNGVGENSQQSKTKSETLLENSQIRLNNTKFYLTDRLNDAKLATNDVDDMNKRIREGNNDLNTQLQGFSQDDLRNRALSAGQVADDAGKRALDAEEKVGAILSRLPEDKNKIDRLANTATKIENNMKDAIRQGADIKNKLPQIIDMIQLIGNKRSSVEALRDGVRANLSQLRENIELAREAANRIRVGLEFLGNTSVTLRNPVNLDQAGSYTTLSMYVQTRQKRALLAYAGAESLPNRITPDYIAMELRDGKPVFKFNLGSGPAEIVSTADISDGNWYKITAQRIGKVGTLTVEGDTNKGIQPQLTTGKSRGTFTVLELNPQTTKFFLGGQPDAFNLPDGLDQTFYEGVIEDVAFDNKPNGVWNFVQAKNNHQGAIERDVMKSVISNGFRFNGRGYVILSASKINFDPIRESNIILRFKTYVENGLIFFMGKDRDFMSLEIKDGRILFQYDLGGMPAKLMTNDTYNDGQWHKIQAQREKQQGSLIVDDTFSIQGRSKGTLSELSYTDEIFIGGYNQLIAPIGGVEPRGFDGCIEDLQFGINKWDLNKNEAAKGVVRGCPPQILRTATVDKEPLGYMFKAIDSVGENFDITFRMKTLSNSSMLLYTADFDQNSGFSVSIVQGRIIVTSDPGGAKLVLESTVNTYNDGKWHYISIMKMGVKLMMNIDDQEMVNKTGSGNPVLLTQRPLYFGGTDFTMSQNLVASTARFSGCVSDVTINGEFLNFASIPRQNVRDISFSECPIEEREEDGKPPTAVPEPTGPPDYEETTTLTPMEPDQLCYLSQNVDVSSVEEGVTDGVQFGSIMSSRMEFKYWKSLRVRSSMTMSIKTTSSAGLLLYATDRRYKDFIALYMRKGKIIFSFDCGTGAAVIETRKTYNDGKWHTIEFARDMKVGRMSVDGSAPIEGASPGSTRSINVKKPYYIGGISPAMHMNDKIRAHLQNVVGSFMGCIRDFKYVDANLGNPTSTTRVSNCSSNLEFGTFFNNNGGYVQLYKKYSIGLHFAFNVEIKPRNMSGVILALHADDGDFIILQMDNGKIIFTVDNGLGEFSTTYTPAVENALCDGKWHRIEANKVKNLVLLTVDGNNAPAGTGPAGSSEINSNHPLYIGGIPDLKRKGVVVNRNFAGCIRNFETNRDTDVYKPQYLTSGNATGDVTFNKCPIN